MKLHYLMHRREKVSKLLTLAMHDRNAYKCLQARFLLEQINRGILQESSLANNYSNLCKN